MKAPPPIAAGEAEVIGVTAKGSGTTSVAILMCLVLAGAVVALDVMVSTRFGLLAYPPRQDGVTYMAGAKFLYYTVLRSMDEPSALGALASNWSLPHAPLWVALMSATFFVFGEGEWQSHVVRIWPVFLWLFLMFWFVRRRWSSRAAWLAAGITALLPTAVPALASCARGPGTTVSFGTCSLGDLRPDFLAAVLLAWAVVLVIENLNSSRSTHFICSGTALGLACLTKPPMAPAFVMTWILVLVYFAAINVGNRRRAAVLCALSVSTAAGMLIPYLVLGGYDHVKDHIRDTLVTQKALWSVTSSPVADLAYYWVWFDRHLWISGWLLLLAGLGAAIAAHSSSNPADRPGFCYLGIAVGWYVLVTVVKYKNPFLGLPFYLFLCLFSWSAIAAARRRFQSKPSAVLGFAILILGGLVIVARAGSFLAWHYNEPPPLIARNKEVLREIALDLRAYIKPGQTYSAGDWWSYAAADVPYYSINRDGLIYPEVWPPYQTPDQIDKFINERVARTKVALLWKEDIAEVSKRVPHASRPDAYAPTDAYQYYRAVHRWINRPGSPYLLVREYTLHFAEDDTLTLQLYAKASPSSLADDTLGAASRR